MKRISYVAGLALLILFAGCKKENDAGKPVATGIDVGQVHNKGLDYAYTHSIAPYVKAHAGAAAKGTTIAADQAIITNQVKNDLSDYLSNEIGHYGTDTPLTNAMFDMYANNDYEISDNRAAILKLTHVSGTFKAIISRLYDGLQSGTDYDDVAATAAVIYSNGRTQLNDSKEIEILDYSYSVYAASLNYWAHDNNWMQEIYEPGSGAALKGWFNWKGTAASDLAGAVGGAVSTAIGGGTILVGAAAGGLGASAGYAVREVFKHWGWL